MKQIIAIAFCTLLGLAAMPSEASAQGAAACPVKLGGILPLSGSMGPVGKRIADSAQLAIEHINQGGGIKGCQVQFILRDDQGQPTVGVDAAKYLIDVERVPALTGTVSSGVSLPILISVVAPAGIPMVSCCSTAATFTTLAQEGKTGGFFFRTLPTVKTQAYASAAIVEEKGYRRIAVIYINTDFGTGMVKDFTRAVEKLGAKIVKAVPYNDNQPSYRAEVNLALAEKPDALFFVAFPQDGATMTREWLSLGGTPNLILNNSLRSPEYVKSVGARFLQNAFGMDNASISGPTVDAFKQAFQAAYKQSPDGPGIYNQYDAVMALGLAMNIAPELSGTAIRDAIRKIQVPDGTVVGTGPDEFKKALALIKEGKPIKYVGATGPVEFDANGDVSGLALIWTVKGDNLDTVRTLTVDDMKALFKKIDG
ncbi:branched-chain amino acid transport system substrate-binding protein [Rhizobiales bacterium GAS113]|nr:branched-chain amino acid transport system substrate-binding protein [Rhizobiales bacterium GAS113]